MNNESRVKKSLLNAKINMAFYFLMLFISFFSRKIFLEKLGADFIGLTGTLQNILGFLNLAELGIGTAVSFALYKPIQQGSKEEISAIISVFGYYYRVIGLIILSIAICVGLFIPFIFQNTIFNFGIIYFAFFSFLLSSLIGYFINYRQILLSADQKNYVVIAYFQTANVVKIIIQLLVAIRFSNLYAWVAIELLFGILHAVILNWKINQTYPWLKTDVCRGKIIRSEYPQIIIKTKQILIHKFKDFLLEQSDQILIFAFVSLKMVAYYSNYVLVISKAARVFSVSLDGMWASVGNLVAENDFGKIEKVFWELLCIRYFIGGTIIFLVSQLIEPFIVLWLGNEYLLDKNVLILLLISSYISITRGAVDMFNNAYGNYGDTWSAWAEAIICIIVTIIAARQWGLTGILLGKIASLIPIVVIWKPIYLYKKGFKTSMMKYWKNFLSNLLVFFVSCFAVISFTKVITISPQESFMNWVVYAIIISVSYLLLFTTLLYFFTNGAKTLVQRILNKI